MWESVVEIFANGGFWTIVIKILITTILTALTGLLGTLLGKIIAKSKNSKIRKYARTCVRAAEQKFPNEGKKMGPEKMQYVMDQLAIRFPKIKDNRFLYNIAEAAVFELNRDMQREKDIEEFEKKYGEKPLMFQDNIIEEEHSDANEKTNKDDISYNQNNINTDQKNIKDQKIKINSF